MSSKPPKKLPKLSPLALSLLDMLTTRGGWHRLDKMIGYALVRRGLVDSRRAVKARGWEYRIHQDALWEPSRSRGASVTTEAQLVRSICLRPEDDLARLVLADHWEENGQPERAEFVRVQMELASIDQAWKDAGHSQTLMRHREQELLRPWGPDDLTLSTIFQSGTPTTFTGEPPWSTTYRRGFVDELCCPARYFLRHGSSLVAAAPLREVRLRDKGPWTVGGSGHCDWFRQDQVGRHDADSIPLEWWEYLSERGEGVKLYESAELAHADLSRAALAWARSIAFPELRQAAEGR